MTISKADDLAKKIHTKLDEIYSEDIAKGLAETENAIAKAADRLKFTTVVHMPNAFVALRVAEHLVALGYTTIRCDPVQAGVLSDEFRVTDTAGRPEIHWSFDWPASAGRTSGDYMREGMESGDRGRTPMVTSIVVSW